MRRLAVLLVLAFVACKHTVVVKPPAPTFTVRVEVFRGDPAADHKVPGALVTLDTVAPPKLTCTTDGAGNCEFTLVVGGPRHVWVAADGFLPFDRHIEIPADLPVKVSLSAVVPPVPVLPRLVAAGTHFHTVEGQPFTAIEASAFHLLARFQHGEDIEPFLREREELGFNMLRVWTHYDIVNIGTFLDLNYEIIPAFLDACARHHLYVEFTAYTGYVGQPGPEDKAHWGKLIAALGDRPNVLLELGNEINLPVNRLTYFAEYQRPVGVLASRGSVGSEGWPEDTKWDYVTFHTNGSFEEQRKVGHNAWEIWGGPTVANETSRWPDVGMWTSGDLARQKLLARGAAAGAALLAAGSCFHSVSGKTAVVFTPDEREVAKAWAEGAHSVPLACQDGPYIHRQDLENANLLRVYERPVAGHDCVVGIAR